MFAGPETTKMSMPAMPAEEGHLSVFSVGVVPLHQIRRQAAHGCWINNRPHHVVYTGSGRSQMGLTLTEFPGKYRLERWLIGRPGILGH